MSLPVFMNKIIKIIPADRVFSVTWNLSIRCNYDCMYCPTTLHDSTSPHPDLETLQNRWISIVSNTQHKSLKYKISFTGGEVTGNKNFVPFLQWLRHNYGHQIDKILITTNGSATYKYYNKLLDCVDNISFSVHSEHIDEKKFFDTVLNLHRNLPTGKHIHVCIMDEYWNVDRIKLYQQLLTNHNISHNVNQIDYSVQTRSHPIMKGKLNLANT